jgi:hypothetical protein
MSRVLDSEGAERRDHDEETNRDPSSFDRYSSLFTKYESIHEYSTCCNAQKMKITIHQEMEAL